MEGWVASLLIWKLFIASRAREDPCVILMAIEEAPAKRHGHVGLAALEILHQHLVRAYGVNDTSPYGPLQLVMWSTVAVRVRGDVLWGGTHVLHWADQI